jgi:hypothetical protein
MRTAFRFAAFLIAMQSFGAPALAGHAVRSPAGNQVGLLYMRPGRSAEFEVYSTAPGCVASTIQVTAQNSSLFAVYAVDDVGVKLPGQDGVTATVSGVESQKFVVEPRASTFFVGPGVRICWNESGASGCSDANCPAGVSPTTILRPKPGAMGANPGQSTDGDPVAMGTGELLLPPRAYLRLGGPRKSAGGDADRRVRERLDLRLR